MIQFSIVYNTNKRVNKNGKALIQIRAYQNGRRKVFSTKLFVTPKQWSKKYNKVIGHPNELQYNAEIRRQLDGDTGYYGRGFVQLTHEKNYLKMPNLLGVDFVKNPHLVLKPEYAARILVQGMLEGSFTRKPLSRYVNAEEQDYFNARRVVNGVDQANKIKGSANSIKQNMA